jgi:hypothetical protein
MFLTSFFGLPSSGFGLGSRLPTKWPAAWRDFGVEGRLGSLMVGGGFHDIYLGAGVSGAGTRS